MDRLFLDANVLFSAAYKPDARLVQLWRIKGIVLCSSRYALEEARVNLRQPDQQQALHKLCVGLHLFDAASGDMPRGITLPEKDRPIFAAALEARAAHLLTGDVQHFGPYLGKTLQGIAITLPGQYLKSRERGV